MPPRLPSSAGPRKRSDAYRYAGLGMQFSAVIGVFAWAGWWLDGKLGTLPLFLVAGVFLGFLGGLISLVSKLPASKKKKPEASEADRKSERPE